MVPCIEAMVDELPKGRNAITGAALVERMLKLGYNDIEIKSAANTLMDDGFRRHDGWLIKMRQENSWCWGERIIETDKWTRDDWDWVNGTGRFSQE